MDYLLAGLEFYETKGLEKGWLKELQQPNNWQLDTTMTNESRKWLGVYISGTAILYLVGQLICDDCSLQSRAVDTGSYLFGVYVLGTAFFANYPFVSHVSSDDRRLDKGLAIITGLFFIGMPLGHMYFIW
ncbi:MAG: hypothetical protein ABF335_07395 [Alphaproteobacteria bacterium]